MTRLLASRTTANASTSMSLRTSCSSSPAAVRRASSSRNSTVLCLSASSESFSISGSIALISGTMALRARTFLPSPARRTFEKTLTRTRVYGVPFRTFVAPSSACSRLLGVWLVDVEQPFAHGVDHGLHPGVQVQLFQDVPDVVLDG